ncbi:hypothetical protein [Haloferula sp. BvORR071]|uniref:hypothetical protein n=1 Tax=Haloferula sp. BvORR071 TaxID=1396141 RepID=UPI00054EDEBF|nr:hypothetical protein [Haloferula sp. BvORR071]
MLRFLPAALAVLGLCMFALSLWLQEGSAPTAAEVLSPPPTREEPAKPRETLAPDALETVPVAMEWSR